MTDDAEEQGNDANDETDHVAVAVDVNVTTPETTTTENSAVNVNVVADDSGVGVSTRSRKRNRDSTGFDVPGPFSTAMKIIRDRGMNVQNAQTSSQTNLCESIKWVPNAKKGDLGILSVPSLQDMCFKILVKNVDAIASLESVPDALRHRLSQLLSDSRRINGHFLELLVRGTPTEIRLRDCSWLTEEQFTECFRMCNTENLLVCGLSTEKNP
ncbi:hypothetical protein LR48_Vigan02g164300 [Vigna angularis]|nr:hypothetical protein LR48_Vigan02g164300 [Vigna angularis]BAT95093.1 hypothetical protein VIGAN_08175700 [Vigna angularis var. angularis]